MSDIYSDFGKATTASMPPPATALKTGMQRGTSAGFNSGPARPMTSKQAAGFNADQGQQIFDPLKRGLAQPQKVESFEDKRKATEKKIHQLVDESFHAQSTGNLPLALEKARESAKKERALAKDLEKHPNATANPDLTFCVLLNLANTYQSNKLFQEALNTFQAIVKNKGFNLAGRLRVNMGNIYFELENYNQAIKMFRMALDQIPTVYQRLRVKILKNIATCYLKTGQLQDAINSLENISETCPDHEIMFNLVVCYHALHDVEKLKSTFQKLMFLEIDSRVADRPSTEGSADEHHVVFQDSLRSYSREKADKIEHFAILAARLVALSAEASPQAGFDWVIEIIKNSPKAKLSNQLEILKALHFMKISEYAKAIDILRAFEKKENFKISDASTILSLLLLKQGDTVEAEKLAEKAVNGDRYNTRALVNLGICHHKKADFLKAKEFYEQALAVDSLFGESLFNVGLLNKTAENHVEALLAFEKLYTLTQNDPEVIYHMADTFEKIGESKLAIEWFERLLSLTPTDPQALLSLARIYAKLGDVPQAYHYYSESYRYHHDNIQVLTWLGTYFVENEMYEKAVQCFYRGALMKPGEIKWQLMVASCLRRSGNYQASLDLYKKIHVAFPENTDCLKFLVRLCSDMGLEETQEFSEKLTQMERLGRNNSLIPSSLESSFVGGAGGGSERSTMFRSATIGSQLSAADTQIRSSRPLINETLWENENVEDMLPS